jgi:hypothetical protein
LLIDDRRLNAPGRRSSMLDFSINEEGNRRRRQVARQGSAKPSSWVQIPSTPLEIEDF